ncbi:MAG: diaminopimelate epimerase [Flavobacteriaceae bacterium]|nr:diaminopimelate epimerase [Flavobacteriaceae bacterium]
MKIKFQKYQGTGNDFIIINNNDLLFPTNNRSFIKRLCNRKFGIGSDGLILINPSKNTDFEMLYFNSDGNLGSMCGNGARCSVKFAQNNKIVTDKTLFNAFDGNHRANIHNNTVSLSMNDVSDIKTYGEDLFLDTGSPHYVKIVKNLENFDVYNQGKLIRNSNEFFRHGVNINFVKIISEKEFEVRTFERGVEDETLSCGTGVTAVALSMHYLNKTLLNNLKIKTKGGVLDVKFIKNNNRYEKIILSGNVELIFEGEIDM